MTPDSALLSVLVVEDDPAIRARLCKAIAAQPNMQVGTACDRVGPALELLATRQPDLLLTDLGLMLQPPTKHYAQAELRKKPPARLALRLSVRFCEARQTGLSRTATFTLDTSHLIKSRPKQKRKPRPSCR